MLYRIVLTARGLRKRIGDGLSTRVWRDAWIPGTHTGRAISPCLHGHEDMMVADLLSSEGSGWDEAKLNHFFLPFERDRISAIRLSHNRPRDEWYWSAEKDGVYTVKSAYYLLAGEEMDTGETSDWGREKWLWNRLWKAPVWPRVKLFFWQLCGEALATKANIVSRVGGEYPFCSFCHSTFESSLHLFRDCWVAQRVWDGLSLNITEMEAEGGRIRDWVEVVWRELGVRELTRFMVGCWALWEHRNKVVFEGRTADHLCVIRRAMDVVEETEGGGTVERGGRMTEEADGGRRKGWEVARVGYVKVNVDAGVKEISGVGVGAVCRDAQGMVEWALARTWKEVWEPHVAEAVAVLEGLEEAARRGHTHVVIESDCRQVIDALQHKKRGRSIFHLVLDDIITLALSFQSVLWSFTNRANNSVAHVLAHFLPFGSSRIVWSDDLPPAVNNAVIADRYLS